MSFNIHERLIHWGENISVDKEIGEIGIISNGAGDLTFGIEMFYPPIHTFSEEEYELHLKNFTNLFKSFFPGLAVQVLDFYFTEKYKSELEDKTGISKHTHKEIQGKPLLKHRSFWFFTAILYENYKIDIDYSKILNQRKIDFSKYPPKKYKEYYKKFIQNLSILYNSLNEIPNIEIKKLKVDDIKSVSYNYFNQSYDNWEEYKKGIKYEPFTCADNQLQIGSQHVGINALETFPSQLDYYNEHPNYKNVKVPNIKLLKANFFPIHLGMSENHVVSSTFLCADKEQAVQRIRKEYSGDTIISLLNKIDFENKKQYIKGNLDEGGIFEKEMNESGSNPYVFSQIVISKHYDKEQLFNSQQAIKRAYQSFDARSIAENSLTAHRFLSHHPGNTPYEQVGNTITLAPQIIRSLSLETHMRSDSNGYLFFDRNDNPLVIDMKEPLGNALINHNMLIFGDSGSGKSFFLNGLVDQLYGIGAHLIILDIGGSYKELANALNLKYIDGADRDSLAFNPFLNCATGKIEKDKPPIYLYNKDLKNKIKKTKKDEDDDFDFTIESVFAIINVIVSGDKEKDKGIDQDTATSLKIAIGEYYKETNQKILDKGESIIPSMTGFHDFLKEYKNKFIAEFGDLVNFESLFLRMNPYIKTGQSAWLFDTNQKIDYSKDRGIIIDVQNIQKDATIYNIMCLSICEVATRKFENLPKSATKFFCIDEAVDFFKGENMGAYIGALFRQIRKFGGMIGIATQNASYLNSLEELARKSILTNAETRAILGMKEASMKEAKELLSLTDGEEKKIKSINKGKGFREFFIKYGYQSYILKNKVSKWAYWIFTTDPKERQIKEKILNKYNNNIEQALQELIYEQEN